MKKRYYFFGIIQLMLLLCIDQITKYFAVVNLKGKPSIPVLPSVFELFYLENHGAAWGILKNARIFFLIVAVILVCLIIFYYGKLPFTDHWHMCRFLMIMLAAGAAGNAIDRFFHGYVIDFFYLSVIDFPVFNVADCYVTISIALFFIFYRKEVSEWIKK